MTKTGIILQNALVVSYAHYTIADFKFLLRVVRDVDKPENGCAVAFIIVQSYAEELEKDILEQG